MYRDGVEEYRAAYNPAFLARAQAKAKERVIRETAKQRGEELQRIAAERKQLIAERLEIEREKREIQRMAEKANRDAESAREIVQSLLATREHLTGFDVVARRLCRVFGVSKADLISARRTHELVQCRQAVCYWASRRTGMSLSWIGRRLNRDHTTVLHSTNIYPKKRADMGRYVRPLR